jgi:hypothetical protein
VFPFDPGGEPSRRLCRSWRLIATGESETGRRQRQYQVMLIERGAQGANGDGERRPPAGGGDNVQVKLETYCVAPLRDCD